jgi:hypothetical protein
MENNVQAKNLEIMVDLYKSARSENGLAKFRANLIEEEIRKVYSVSDEISIIRQRDIKPDEFETYNNFVESVKDSVDDFIKELEAMA